MSEKYAIVEIKKLKSLNVMSGMENHNFRLHPKAAPNADASRSHLNRVLVNDGIYNYRELWRSRQYEVNMSGGECVPRKNSVFAYDVNLRVSHDALSDEEAYLWAEKSVAWLKETFGKENVLSAVLHMDEETPHIHAVVIPIDDRNRLCAYSFTGQRRQMFALQKSYADAVKEFGLQKGVTYNKPEQRAIRKFYRRISQIENLDVPQPEQGEDAIAYSRRIEDYMQGELSRAYNETNKVKRKLALAETKHRVFLSEHKEILSFADCILEKTHKETEKFKQLLQLLTELIEIVPLSVIEATAKTLVQKYQREDVQTWPEPSKQEDIHE